MTSRNKQQNRHEDAGLSGYNNGYYSTNSRSDRDYDSYYDYDSPTNYGYSRYDGGRDSPAYNNYNLNYEQQGKQRSRYTGSYRNNDHVNYGSGQNYGSSRHSRNDGYQHSESRNYNDYDHSGQERGWFVDSAESARAGRHSQDY